MKLFLFVFLTQALLGAHVFSQSPENDDDLNSAEFYQQIVSSNDKFTKRFYSQLAAANPNKNLFFSSLSITFAFIMLSLGAKSETHQQILEGLGFNTSVIAEEDIHKGFQQLLKDLNRNSTSIALNVNNAFFADKTYTLLQEFQDKLKLYQSEIIPTDFTKMEEAKDQINGYIEEKTNGLIKNLLNSLDQSTVFALINVIYFKGTWVDIFNKNKTREEDFHVNENTVVKVPMMRRDGVYPVAFLNDVGCTVVEVPYKENVSAIFVLPDEGKLQAVEKAFQEGSLKTWMKDLQRRRILLSLPKFSTEQTIELKDVLSQLGIRDVFSDSANLSGITERDNFKVSKATHKAVVNVDEEGTEAAGVTVIAIGTTSLPPEVKMNRSFLMFIIDNKSGSQIFTVRIINPQE